MAGITLEQAEERLQEYLDAESAVLTNQEYQINGRRLTRANLAEIQQGITSWDQRCKALGGSGSLGGRRVVIARLS
jgi:hypothetical protein